MSSTRILVTCLERLSSTLTDHGIWHCLAYGTLLGAVRDGDVIPWDDDIDLLVRPDQVDRILGLNPLLSRHGIVLHPVTRSGKDLAVNPSQVRSFSPGNLAILVSGDKCGDLYAFNLFSDGVLRRFDLATGVYWCPHSSFPFYFLEHLESATVRGLTYPAPRQAERWLAGVYGDDWRIPYRAPRQGGSPRAGTTSHGDGYHPKLKDELAWCMGNGWEPARYRSQLRWPRTISGAGPIGPSQRTQDTSRALWWRDFDELIEHF